MKKPATLVSGGAGFIGSHITDHLRKAGYSVRILDNLSPQVHGEIPAASAIWSQNGVEFIRGSVLDRKTWARALKDVEIVIHLASETGTGQSMYEIGRYNGVNSQGTALMLDVLANTRPVTVGKIILASSRSVYGEGAYRCGGCGQARLFPEMRSRAQLEDGRWDPICPFCGATLSPLPAVEDDLVKPASVYAATKLAQENLIRIGCDALGVGHIILRLQNVYGEGQSLKNPYTGILSVFSNKIRSGQLLPVFEDGRETRDFVHVHDVVNAFFLAMEHEEAQAGVFNVGTGRSVSVKEIAVELSRAFDEDPKLRITGEYRIGDIRHNSADISKIRRAFGYSPAVGLDRGLRRFAAWVNSQPAASDCLEQANTELRERRMLGIAKPRTPREN